jgi:hypothetical protein
MTMDIRFGGIYQIQLKRLDQHQDNSTQAGLWNSAVINKMRQELPQYVESLGQVEDFKSGANHYFVTDDKTDPDARDYVDLMGKYWAPSSGFLDDSDEDTHVPGNPEIDLQNFVNARSSRIQTLSIDYRVLPPDPNGRRVADSISFDRVNVTA